MEGNLSMVGSLEIKLRVYYSTYHLWAAEHFANLAKAIENAHTGRSEFKIEHRAYITSSILASTAFLEAAVNELFQDISDNYGAYVFVIPSDAQELIHSFWDLTEGKGKSSFSLLDKYQIALTLTRQQSFKKGEALYQNVDLVTKLRNALVHYKPEMVGGSEVHKFEKSLGGKFPLNKLMEGSGNPFFPDKCLGYGCASWAVNSSRHFADTFFSKMGVKPNYQSVTFEPKP